MAIEQLPACVPQSRLQYVSSSLAICRVHGDRLVLVLMLLSMRCLQGLNREALALQGSSWHTRLSHITWATWCTWTLRYMALPSTLARAAPDSWQVNRADGTITKKRMKRLEFAILRELLSPKALRRAFKLSDGRPVRRRSHCCLVSVRQGRARTLEKRGVKVYGRRTQGSEKELRRQGRLKKHKVPEWIVGTRLKFQSGRWCVAPPKISRETIGEWEARVSELSDPDILEEPEGLEERAMLIERIQNAERSVFTPVSRLLCYAKRGHPNDQPEFDETVTSEVMAVHHACEGSRVARARCLNRKHIVWGDVDDNAYHRVMHGALPDESQSSVMYKLPAKKSRPELWHPPSKHDGFVPLRKRLREKGSRRLYFT